MVTNKSTQAYINVLNNNHIHLKNQLKNLLTSITNGLKARATKDAIEVEHYSKLISDSLIPSDIPHWLKLINEYIKIFKKPYDNQNHETVFKSHNFLTIAYSQAINFKWTEVSEENISNINFDQIYIDELKKSNIPALFDSIIALLEELIKSGEFDSITLKDSLEHLISLINKNKSKSYLSLLVTHKFWKTFFKNYLIKKLTKIDSLETFKETIEQLEVKNKELETEVMNTNIIIINSISERINETFKDYKKIEQKLPALSDLNQDI